MRVLHIVLFTGVIGGCASTQKGATYQTSATPTLPPVVVLVEPRTGCGHNNLYPCEVPPPRRPNDRPQVQPLRPPTVHVHRVLVEPQRVAIRVEPRRVYYPVRRQRATQLRIVRYRVERARHRARRTGSVPRRADVRRRGRPSRANGVTRCGRRDRSCRPNRPDRARRSSGKRRTPGADRPSRSRRRDRATGRDRGNRRDRGARKQRTRRRI